MVSVTKQLRLSTFRHNFTTLLALFRLFLGDDMAGISCSDETAQVELISGGAVCPCNVRPCIKVGFNYPAFPCKEALPDRFVVASMDADTVVGARQEHNPCTTSPFPQLNLRAPFGGGMTREWM